MEDDKFFEVIDHQITALKARAENLKESARHIDPTLSEIWMLEALEELSTALEELSTALEELRVTQEEYHLQNEELIITRQLLDDQRRHYHDLFDNAPDGYLVSDLKGIIQQANRAASRMLNVRQDHLVQKPFLVYFAEADRAEFHTFLKRFTDAQAPADQVETWEVQLAPRHAPEITAALTITVIYTHNGKPLALRWLLRDVTHQKRMEHELRTLNMNLEMRVRERTELLETETRLKDEALARARAARDEAEALRDIGNTLSSTLNLAEVLENILATVGRLVHHDGADVLLIDNKTAAPALCTGYAYCSDQKMLQALRFPIAETFPLNEIAKSGHAYVIDELNEPTTWMKALGMSFTARSYVGVPVFAQGALIGFLNLTYAVSHYYVREHLEVLRSFSTQASVAIQNAQLYNQAKAVTILEERQRLARDLHDAVSQSLFTSTIVAEALLHNKEPKSERLNEQLEYLLRLNRGAQAEMRSLLLELRPAHITDVDLAKQVRGLVEAARGRKEIDITLVIDDGVPMPPEVQIQFYRIAQEALNNIIKHSRANRATIRLLSDDEAYAST
jgi:PAS domain S-box-containing protein